MNNIERLHQKIDVFTSFTKTIASLSVSQTLKVGAVAVRIDFSDIESFGYNGSYSGATNNSLTNGEEISLEPGKSGFVHAEMNLCGKFKRTDPENYIILLTHSPCEICTSLLINTGFRYIYWESLYRNTDHLGRIFSDVGYDYVGDYNKLKNDYLKILERYYERKY